VDYAAEVAAVLPHLDEMMALGSAGIFGLRQPHHSLPGALRRVAADVLGEGRGYLAGRDG
jgi:hypothetical protein